MTVVIFEQSGIVESKPVFPGRT